MNSNDCPLSMYMVVIVDLDLCQESLTFIFFTYHWLVVTILYYDYLCKVPHVPMAIICFMASPLPTE